jgi:hypothetical protein
MTRDAIAQAMMLQQRRGPGQPLGSPFAPPPVPPRQAPLVAGSPTPPPVAPTPQYGFQTGFNAAMGSQPFDTSKDKGWKDLYDRLFGAAPAAGGAAP